MRTPRSLLWCTASGLALAIGVGCQSTDPVPPQPHSYPMYQSAPAPQGHPQYQQQLAPGSPQAQPVPQGGGGFGTDGQPQGQVVPPGHFQHQ